MTAREAHTTASAGGVSSRARDYFALTKPKVVSLIMFTAIVGMFLAVPGFPPAAALFWGTIGSAPRDLMDPESPEIVLDWEDLQESVSAQKSLMRARRRASDSGEM